MLRKRLYRINQKTEKTRRKEKSSPISGNWIIRVIMRKFNYLNLMDLSIPVSVYNMIANIHEYKGKQELYVQNYPDVLESIS